MQKKIVLQGDNIAHGPKESIRDPDVPLTIGSRHIPEHFQIGHIPMGTAALAALAGALVEAPKLPVNDNVRVPFVMTVVLWAHRWALEEASPILWPTPGRDATAPPDLCQRPSVPCEAEPAPYPPISSSTSFG